MYALIYTENADVLGTYDSLSAVRDEVGQLERAQPGIEEELGLVDLDESGRPVGDVRPARGLGSASSPAIIV